MTKTVLLHDDILVNEMSEDVKKRIMGEGFPLQRFCAKKLQKLGWSVDEEYPVEQVVPPLGHPYYFMGGPKTRTRTSGDLRATKPYTAKGFALCVCISCKRQLKIDWSFMKAMFIENVHRMIRNKKEANDVNKYVFRLNDGLDLNYTLCNIPTNLYQREDLPKQDDKIVHTSEHLYLETLQSTDDDHTWLSIHAPYGQMIYIPIIVTAAKIHAYDIDENKFDIGNTNSIDIKEVNYLLYQHHLPRSMHLSLEDQQSEDRLILDKFNLFVVNYQHFESFIESLMKKFEDHPM